MTDKTSVSIRLNSSKQHQQPEEANPLKNLLIPWILIPSVQLNTLHMTPTHLDKSFTDSVFPVPAGPSGAPPYLTL